MARKQHAADPGRPLLAEISLEELRAWVRTTQQALARKMQREQAYLALDRQACMSLIQQAGLPVPPKSSCWFCPYHSQRSWQTLRETRPELFERAVALERLINERRAVIGKDQVFLSRKCKPLPMATSEYLQSSFFEDDQVCESGYCFV